MATWPPAWAAFAEALPFEHRLRGRPPADAMARCRSEASAFAAQDGPCIAMLLDPRGTPAQLQATLASWHLQTWPRRAWIVVADADTTQALRSDGAMPDPVAVLASPDAASLRALGIDWVVPACAGDVLHPSLAGVVAMAARDGAGLVAWDWLETEWLGSDQLRPVSRHRAPACDRAAELERDTRGRAFALPAHDWHGTPLACRSARVRAAAARPADRVHPEPLGLYPAIADNTVLPARDAEAAWSVPFHHAPGAGPEPASPARSVSVLLMFRDRAELTSKAIASVAAQCIPGRVQLVLIDNGSTQASVRAIESTLASLPPSIDVRWLDCPGPFNHSRQARLGAAEAEGEVLLFLNNDAELLDANALDRLTRWARVPGVASVGGCVVDDAGAAVGGGFRARATPGAVFNSPVEEAAGEGARHSRETIGNTFACAAVSADAFRTLGGLDEVRFPAGFNDVDYCLRACAAGWTHVNLADVRIRHAVGASRARQDEAAQKIALRLAHPWVMLHALQEPGSEAVALPAISITTLLEGNRVPA